MNIPFPNKTDREVFFQNQMGNAGNGGNPNPPTIPLNPSSTMPRVNLSKDFIIGGYNNNLESFVSPTNFSETWDDNYYSNNPVGITKWTDAPGGLIGVAGNGDNQNGAGFTPNAWEPYDVNSLGAIAGSSQSYPYDKNSIYLDGGVERVWKFTDNLNEGAPQSVEGSVVQKLPSLDDVQNSLAQLKKELDDGNF